MRRAPRQGRGAPLEGAPAYIALNKRPGSPLPVKTREFLAFALSRDGQEIVARDARFSPLTAAEASTEREKIGGYLADLDPALSSYRAQPPVSGAIRSVGSDGMKTLMDRRMPGFNPGETGVVPGSRWE